MAVSVGPRVAPLASVISFIHTTKLLPLLLLIVETDGDRAAVHSVVIDVVAVFLVISPVEHGKRSGTARRGNTGEVWRANSDKGGKGKERKPYTTAGTTRRCQISNHTRVQLGEARRRPTF
ncbi:hypothetical protein HYQ44_011209 [Verticillium longisporum]|nr:hypothetical protein HYQ44_011209 [Verticillium longisporum]